MIGPRYTQGIYKIYMSDNRDDQQNINDNYMLR